MSAQHTPGPWTLGIGGADRVFATAPNARKRLVAIAAHQHGDEDYHYAECGANAVLIAAAPDLLEAAQAALRWFDSQPAMQLDWRDRVEVSKTLRAAIARATEAAP